MIIDLRKNVDLPKKWLIYGRTYSGGATNFHGIGRDLLGQKEIKIGSVFKVYFTFH